MWYWSARKRAANDIVSFNTKSAFTRVENWITAHNEKQHFLIAKKKTVSGVRARG